MLAHRIEQRKVADASGTAAWMTQSWEAPRGMRARSPRAALSKRRIVRSALRVSS